MKLLLTMVVLLGGSALAQTPKVQFEKKTIIDLDGDTIEGELTKPNTEYVESRRRVRHLNLIKDRKNFDEKVLESVGEL